MAKRQHAKTASDTAFQSGDAWLDEEIGRSRFRDERLAKRFRLVLERLWSCIGQSIPMAFQDWCNTKAAYRFLSNPKVTEQDILGGHFECTGSDCLDTGLQLRRPLSWWLRDGLHGVT